MHVLLHEMIRALPECTHQSCEAPVPIVLECLVYWASLCEPRIPLHGLHPSFPTHRPLTILRMKALFKAQRRMQAVGAGTAENASPHARPTPASSDSLAAFPTGGIMGPTAAHGFRTTYSPLQARGPRAEMRGQGGFQVHHGGGSPLRNLASGRASGEGR